MTWLLIGGLIWVAVALVVALLLGRTIRLADARRARESQAAADANFVVPGTPSAPASPAEFEEAEQPWTGPSTVPFAPSRLPWGGVRPSGARAPRPPVLRAPVTPAERDAAQKDRDRS